MKRLFSFTAFIILFGIIGYLLIRNTLSQRISEDPNKITIYASIYPLSFFAGEIGGDKVSVVTITPPGTEPHEYEPNPSKLASIYKGKILIINGAGLETWTERIKSDLFSNDITLITASDGIELIKKSGQPDPHVWLDPVFAQRMVLNIRDGLMENDSQNATYYRSNADDLIVKLINLDNQYKKSLFDCQQDTVVASHSVFGYLGNRYKFKQYTLSGLSPDDEPSPKKVAEIIEEIENKGIKYILTETLVSHKTADTLANEAGITTLVFNPLEGLTKAEASKRLDYFSIQQENLKTLISSLQCREQ